MPSTYTNDLRLELIAVGEGAGSAHRMIGAVKQM